MRIEPKSACVIGIVLAAFIIGEYWGKKSSLKVPCPLCLPCSPRPANSSSPVGDKVNDRVYFRPSFFKKNYDEMEKRFKVYVYPDGDDKTYYHTPRKITGRYASEGFFLQNIRESRFLTNDPDAADMFFIPISCHKIVGNGMSYNNMTVIIQGYVDSLIAKYPYWNRSLGADHFIVTCHEDGLRAIEHVPSLTKNSIRVVCSSSIDLGFIRHKDISLPQVLLPFPLPMAGNDLKNRTGLAFWSGNPNHGIRRQMAMKWKNDEEMDVSNSLLHMARGPLSSHKKFLKNKFCICPRGYIYNTARIADSIHYGCVPVILSDLYTLPFSSILDWRRFSIRVKEKDVLELKNVLKRIGDSEFALLHKNLHKVQKHFEWNTPPVKYDAFHMVMYELWMRLL